VSVEGLVFVFCFFFFNFDRKSLYLEVSDDLLRAEVDDVCSETIVEH
jgi:hypothetical protein